MRRSEGVRPHSVPVTKSTDPVGTIEVSFVHTGLGCALGDLSQHFVLGFGRPGSDHRAACFCTVIQSGNLVRVAAGRFLARNSVKTSDGARPIRPIKSSSFLLPLKSAMEVSLKNRVRSKAHLHRAILSAFQSRFPSAWAPHSSACAPSVHPFALRVYRFSHRHGVGTDALRAPHAGLRLACSDRFTGFQPVRG